MNTLHVNREHYQRALARFPQLAAHLHLAEAVTLMGIDNHIGTCYYEATEFYLAKYPNKFDANRLEQACKVAHANDHLEQLVFGEHSETQKLIRTNEEYKYLDHFLDTVFGETDDSDPAAP